MARVLLYDADCGFCVRSIGWLRDLRCDVEFTPWQAFDVAAYGIAESDAARAIHLIDGSRIRVGHEAIAATLGRSSYPPARWTGWLLGRRVTRPLAARVYAAVAEHRHRLPGGSAACAWPVPGGPTEMARPR